MANSIVSTKNADGSIVMSFKNGTSLPKTKFQYTIIQSNENIQYFQPVGMSVLTYKEPVIGSWKLIDETKVINTMNCKKRQLPIKEETGLLGIPRNPIAFMVLINSAATGINYQNDRSKK
jgi:GLPGLI family protein